MTTPVDPPGRARSTDSPDEARRYARLHISERRRTIIISVVSACIIALFIGWANDRDQRDRSVKNCQATQEDRYDRIDTLRETAGANYRQSDNTLGNKKPLVYKEGKPYGKLVAVKKPIPPADFNVPPYSAFKDFKALILAQAKEQRLTAARNVRRANKAIKRVENCDKVFPAPNPIPFM